MSSCRAESLRHLYVKELEKYMDVDIYGRCSETNRTCGKRSHMFNSSPERNYNGECEDILQENYKFYLAFENSFCEEYISEKVFDRMPLSLVPIVLGMGDYTKFLPPHSYINALEYGSPENLAKYIKYLSNNDTEYLSYFWWRQHYKVANRVDRDNNFFCQVCSMLHNDSLPAKTYYDLQSWWTDYGNCYSGPFPWQKKIAYDSEVWKEKLESEFHLKPIK